MKRKRLLAVASSMVAMGGLLGSPQTQVAHADSTPITITFWNAYSATSGEQREIEKVVIPAFEKLHPNIKVQNVTLPYSSMQTKLFAAAAGGQLPDVARLDIIWVPQLAKMGALVAQDSLSGFSTLKKEVFDGPLSTNIHNGKYYGLPLDTNTKVLFSNTSVLKNAGITKPPKTMTQFIGDIKKLTHGSGKRKVYGYMAGGTDLWNLVPWISAFGGSVLSPDKSTATGYLNGAKTVNAITTLVNLFKQGYITGLLPGANGDMTGLAQGQYAMIDEGPWDVPSMAQQYPKVKYGMSLFPAGAGGSGQVVGGEDIGVFNTDSAHQQAAWEFEKFMLSATAQQDMQSVGQMSVLKTLPKSNAKGQEYYSIFRQQLASAVSRPAIPNYNQVDSDISNAVTLAAQSKMTVKAALEQATQQVNSLLN